MGLMDMIDGAMDAFSPHKDEIKVKLYLTSGRQMFHLAFYEKYVILRVNSDGFIYFDDIDGLYKITDFQWDGREYETVSTVSGGETTNGKIKKTGRLGGALVGGIVADGKGAAIGALLGNGNKKFQNKTSSNYTTVDSRREVATPAYMTIYDAAENVQISFGFDCDSKLYGELQNVFARCMAQK